MEFDKKTILAFLLIGLILIFLQTEFYQKNFLPQPEPQVIPPRRVLDSEQQVPRALEPTREASGQQEVGLGSASKYENLSGIGENVTVETDLYRAVFSTRGATARSWELKNYLLKEGPRVQLIGEDGDGDLGIILPTDDDTLDTSSFVFTVDKKELRLDSGNSTNKLEFILAIDEYKKIKKTYTFYNDRYDVTLTIDFINLGSWVRGFSYFLTWRTGLRSTEPNLADDMSKAFAYALQGDAEKFDVNDEFNPGEWDNPTDWAAIRTKYFTVAVIPQGVQAQAVTFEGQQVDVGKKTPWEKYAFTLHMPYRDASKTTYTLYLGPLDYDIVTRYNVDLEKMMDLGWAIFRPFGKAIVWSFNLFHKAIPNYGVIIIIFSVLIKILLYPLTRKSYQSMKEMQSLQPLMQELNEKHKSDPHKKQQEVMKLYKEHGVNPLGGCIPMVLQMPLLIALFQVFQSTIQLRQAPFVWWIQDLSGPDTVALLPFSLPLYGNTVNILPLFMGVTMFIQQKISMKDPKQKMLVYIMPIFFTLLFNSFPSGLNLYYALFNLLTILQEKLIPHKPPKKQKAPKKQGTKRRRVKHDYRGGFYK